MTYEKLPANQQIGKQLIVNNIKYLKTSFKWYNAMLFIISSPFNYWFWIHRLVKGKFSFNSTLGSYYNSNAFDLLDIESYIKISSFTILFGIEEFANKYGFMTEELKQVISNNITNTQNIAIKKSRGIKFGKVELKSA